MSELTKAIFIAGQPNSKEFAIWLATYTQALRSPFLTRDSVTSEQNAIAFAKTAANEAVKKYKSF